MVSQDDQLSLSNGQRKKKKKRRKTSLCVESCETQESPGSIGNTIEVANDLLTSSMLEEAPDSTQKSRKEKQPDAHTSTPDTEVVQMVSQDDQLSLSSGQRKKKKKRRKTSLCVESCETQESPGTIGNAIEVANDLLTSSMLEEAPDSTQPRTLKKKHKKEDLLASDAGQEHDLSRDELPIMHLPTKQKLDKPQPQISQTDDMSQGSSHIKNVNNIEERSEGDKATSHKSKHSENIDEIEERKKEDSRLDNSMLRSPEGDAKKKRTRRRRKRKRQTSQSNQEQRLNPEPSRGTETSVLTKFQESFKSKASNHSKFQRAVYNPGHQRFDSDDDKSMPTLDGNSETQGMDTTETGTIAPVHVGQCVVEDNVKFPEPSEVRADINTVLLLESRTSSMAEVLTDESREVILEEIVPPSLLRQYTTIAPPITLYQEQEKPYEQINNKKLQNQAKRKQSRPLPRDLVANVQVFKRQYKRGAIHPLSKEEQLNTILSNKSIILQVSSVCQSPRTSSTTVESGYNEDVGGGISYMSKFVISMKCVQSGTRGLSPQPPSGYATV